MTTPHKYKLLPASAMARQVHVSARWLKCEVDAGRLPALKAGDDYVFDPELVEAAIVERARSGRTLDRQERKRAQGCRARVKP